MVAALEEHVATRLKSLPIIYKVLIANVLIVLLGAIAGTWLTVTLVVQLDAASRPTLILFYATVGVILSVLINFIVLRAAFQPLDELERVAVDVQMGNLDARAHAPTFSDPQLARLGNTFNGTLDELQRDREQLRDLANQVINAQEEERKRIARELHDDTAQVLFAQLLRVTAMKASSEPEIRSAAELLEGMTVEAIESVKRLALELRPPALDDLGLREALADLAQRFIDQTGLRIDLHTSGSRDRISSEVELVLYRVAQEALTNAAKHAEASRVGISLMRRPDSIMLAIEDDGIGLREQFDRKRMGRGIGLGLFGMEERVALVGGLLEIRAVRPHGVRIVATIPLGSNVMPTLRRTERILVP